MSLNKPKSLVYVVDDDAAVCESLESLLRSAGYDVVSFRSPAEFLARRRSRALACLVLDVQLPGTSGLELQNELREREPGLPIVFISGHGDIPMSVRAIKAGAFEFLPKPFGDEQLLAAIEQALGSALITQRQIAERAELEARLSLLTPREREVMELVITGMLNKQVAGALGISEVTVKIHRGQAMHKMQASSLAALVQMAGALDLLPARA